MQEREREDDNVNVFLYILLLAITTHALFSHTHTSPKQNHPQDEFTQYKQGRIFVGTWNVNAKGKDESLASWLCADWAQHGPPDVVVVGFQEMVDLNAVNVAVENKSQQRSQFWVDRIRNTLNGRENTGGDPMRAYTQLAVSLF